MQCPPLAFFGHVSGLLEPIATSFLGKRYLAQQDAPRRFVWIVTGEVGSTQWRPGLAPRSLHKDEWTFDVHCWGEDFEVAYRLRQALITALRSVALGANYQLGRTAAPLGDDTWTSLGEVLVVTVTLFADLLEGDLNALGDAPTTRVRPKAVDLERPPPDWPVPGRLVSKEK